MPRYIVLDMFPAGRSSESVHYATVLDEHALILLFIIDTDYRHLKFYLSEYGLGPIKIVSSFLHLIEKSSHFPDLDQDSGLHEKPFSPYLARKGRYRNLLVSKPYHNLFRKIIHPFLSNLSSILTLSILKNLRKRS